MFVDTHFRGCQTVSPVRQSFSWIVSEVNHYVLFERRRMNAIRIDRLAQRIEERRGGKGIREAAKEVGVSPATLSRIENGKIPDLETFGKVCRWLGEDPAIYLGLDPQPATAAPTARVHFKKGAAIRPDTAKALAEMILAAQDALLKEELES